MASSARNSQRGFGLCLASLHDAWARTTLKPQSIAVSEVGCLGDIPDPRAVGVGEQKQSVAPTKLWQLWRFCSSCGAASLRRYWVSRIHAVFGSSSAAICTESTGCPVCNRLWRAVASLQHSTAGLARQRGTRGNEARALPTEPKACNACVPCPHPEFLRILDSCSLAGRQGHAAVATLGQHLLTSSFEGRFNDPAEEGQSHIADATADMREFLNQGETYCVH